MRQIPRLLRDLIRWSRKRLGDRHPGERCWSWRCFGRRLGASYLVNNEIWAAVIGDDSATFCLSCFDRCAEVKGVPYHLEVGNPFAVSWSDWVDIETGIAESERLIDEQKESLRSQR